MCGRIVSTSSPDVIRAMLGYAEQPNFPPRFNIAPTQPIALARLFEGRRQFALARWGLIPAWVKDPRDFSLLINARGETVNDKPAFNAAMRYRRCLIPADGFYEWQRMGGRSRPFFVRRRDRAPFAFAGLWENWMGPNGEEVETAAIVTTRANATLASIHDRMPVIIPPGSFDAWLDCRAFDAQTASGLIKPSPDDLLEAYEVSTAVNRTANDFPALIEPATEAQKAEAEMPPVATRRKRAVNDSGQGSLF
ncbi:MAG TPA: SOS response-associated peptidase [Pseudolabrys sp.]|nr:SOS response-associated peptidase [Pseudolabrys sp.]